MLSGGINLLAAMKYYVTYSTEFKSAIIFNIQKIDHGGSTHPNLK